MRITYLYQYFSTPSEPKGIRCFETARRLVERGHEVNVVTSRSHDTEDAAPGWAVENVEGFNVHRIVNPYSNGMSSNQRIRSFLKFAVACSRRAATLKADIVFASSTPLTIAIPGMYAASRQKAAFILEIRDSWPAIPIALGVLTNPILKSCARLLEKMAYKHARAIITLSPGMRDEVIRVMGPTDKVTVVPNAADVKLLRVPVERGTAFLTRRPEFSGGPLFSYIGTFGRVNNLRYLVDIASAMVAILPEARFLVAGDGSEREEIIQHARERGILERSFFMIGPVPKAEVGEILSASTVALGLLCDEPALWHNSSNKFFDALAAGRPIAINHEGWMADLLREHKAGLVLPANDSIAAAASLAAFALDEAQLLAVGKAAAQLADVSFDRDILVQRLIEVFERVGTRK